MPVIFIIADAARIAPHSLRRLTLPNEAQAELPMLLGYDDDLAGRACKGFCVSQFWLIDLPPVFGPA